MGRKTSTKCVRHVLYVDAACFGLVKQTLIGRFSLTGWLHDVTVNQPDYRSP